MTLDDLIAWAREHRQGTPEGDLRDFGTLAEVLRILLRAHLERSEPQPAPDRVSDQPTGFVTIRGAVPPARTPASCDQTSRELATLIGYIEDSR